MSYAVDPTATVAAVLMPGERPRVDAAGNGLFAVLHRDSIHTERGGDHRAAHRQRFQHLIFDARAQA